jgi:lipoate-protein ligase A
MSVLRVHPLETRSGPANLAADDVLLDRAAAGELGLRFYHWDRPTLSLGYFQPAAERMILPDLPWVRRATGGHTILHGDGDLTYSLAIPAGVPLPDGETVWGCAVHHRIQAVVKRLGVAARPVVCGEEKTLGPVLCFQRHTPGDLVIDGVKVVGSAQRKRRGAILQHGTIRLRGSELVPQLPGVRELAGVVVSADEMVTGLTGELCRVLNRTAEPATWANEDERRIAEVERQYRSSEWNEKR